MVENADERRKYVSPLSRRYASEQMQYLFSEEKRILTWRELWIALAEAEMNAGLSIIRPDMIAEMKEHKGNIDWEFAAQKEKKIRHDVMAHVHAFGEVAPLASGIIHLGATSCFVTDNADLIIYREALKLLHQRLLVVMNNLADFALKYKDLPTLGYTHFQPAQPTTVGKRATLWLYDFYVAAQEIEQVIKNLRFRGIKGATGTQASFMTLFDDNEEKVKQVDDEVTQTFGFKDSFPVTGQTYSRIEDVRITNALTLVASASAKFAEDMRLLSHEKELQEPFGEKQVGSSAMPYKRNPMKSERVCSLARFLKNLSMNAQDTHQHQWLERTLDDSANRRLTMPEAFLTAEAITLLCAEISDGIVVNEEIIRKNLDEHAPLLLTEELMMHAASKGTSRQDLHEKIREHSHAAMRNLKETGTNDLKQRLLADTAFTEFKNLIESDEIFASRAASQTEDFVKTVRKYIADFGIAEKTPETSV
ncbi:MAG: adenylosuccinate lyase [Planctomycetes bacterium]|nr:adenylosuccinate lyase [Planctomycetota bacterium]